MTAPLHQTGFAVLFGVVGIILGQPKQEEHVLPGELSARDREFQHCAAVCAECMNQCEANYQHCARMVADGKKVHLGSMQMSRDCADLCDVAGRLCARQSPLAMDACATCAKACDECAAECEKHGDAHMRACAKVCRDCAKVCREMVKQVARAR